MEEPGKRRFVVKPRSTLLALSSPPFLWLGLFFLFPLFITFALSFRDDMRGELFSFWTPTLKQYQTILDYWRLLGISLAMAFGVAILAIALAYPVAYFVVFRAGRAAGVCLLLLLIPFWTSFLLRVMSWTFVLGEIGGPIDDLLLYSRSAVFITLIYVWIPFAALPIIAALQGIDPELVEAALDLGASPWRCFRTIIFPLSLPGVLAAFFMVFIPTVGEYVTPPLVGAIPHGIMYGNVIEISFRRMYNWPPGAALSVVMLIVTLLLVALAVRLVNLNAVRMTQTRAVITAKPKFTLLTLYFAGTIALLYLPLAVLFLSSFTFNSGIDLSSGFQDPLQNYKQLGKYVLGTFAGQTNAASPIPEMVSSAGNSVIVASVSSCAAVVLGTSVSLLHMRFNFRGNKLLFSLAILPLVVPAVILAVALRVLFNAADIDRSLWTLAVAHSVVALPYVVLIVSARLASFDPDLEEAAMDLGAPYGRVIVDIVLPLVGPSILSAWLVAFTVSLDEVAIAWFLAGTDKTFPVFLFTQLRFSNRLPIIIAFAVVMIMFTMLPVLIAEYIRRRAQRVTVQIA